MQEEPVVEEGCQPEPVLVEDSLIHPWLYAREFLFISCMREVLRPIARECRGLVLDYGCGCKPWRSLFVNAKKYVGADMTAHAPGDLALNDDSTIPVPSNYADVVVSFSTLEHVPDIELYLKEAHRVLRSGGRFLLVTHGIWPYHPCPGHYDDYWRWTGVGLRRVVSQCGLETFDVGEICGGWMSLVQQLAALSDPWVEPAPRLLRWLRYSLTGLINAVAYAAYLTIGTRKPRPGDIIPIAYILQARKP